MIYSIKHHVYIEGYRGVWEDEALYTRRNERWRWRSRWRPWRKRQSGAAAAAGGVAQGAPAAPAGHKGYAAPNPLPPWLLGAVEKPSPL